MQPRTIVIAGGSTTAWLAASVLRRALSPALWSVTVIEEPGGDLDPPAHAVFLPPRALDQLERFGFGEAMLLSAARGTIALGVALSDWSGESAAFQALGASGAPLGVTAFHHLVARLRTTGLPVSLSNYSLAALCAQANRFARPAPHDRSVLSTLRYGLNVDAQALARLLHDDAIAREIIVVPGGIKRVLRDAEGLIAALVTSRDATIAGDLFIDCTGAGARLIGEACAVGFADWRHWLRCDRQAHALHPADGAPASYTHVAAHESGWQRFVPLDGAVEETFVFASSEATASPANASRFAPGRRKSFWRGNCLAIGDAAAVIDPLMNHQLPLAVAALSRLLGLLPANRACHAESAEYDRQAIAEVEGARDIAIAAYKLNGREGQPFWDACRAMPVPDRLEHRIALYRSCGRVALHDDEYYDEADWVALLDALGVRPRRYDVQADGPTHDEIEAHLARIRDLMLHAVAGLPTHDAYLRSQAQ